MKSLTSLIIFASVCAAASSAIAQSEPPAAPPGTAPDERSGTFSDAASDVQKRLDDSLAELTRLREQIAEEKIPLARTLSDLESELIEVRQQYQQTTRLLDSRTLDLTNIRSEIKSREEEATYLSNLLGEYIRNFESRLHITELQRFRDKLEAANLAPENSNLTERQVFETQADLLTVSLERLHEVLGGTRFEGQAVDSSRLVRSGTIALIGPVAVFKAADNSVVGTAEQRLGSLEPSIVSYEQPEDVESAKHLVAGTGGMLPLDPTLGNAHKIIATKETLWEHIQKGGPVMVPIFVLAGLAFLVALYKWLALIFVRKPSKRKVKALLAAVAARDIEQANRAALAIRGPAGRMLVAGVEHLNEPRELIEEVMYETVLASRLKLQRMLPFIAICAASAPLLGLLGTVTGIMNTFKLITVFGTGDVKTLSSGISEALITTEFGLIVAIPSLLLHALLSRKAKGVIDQMEKAAVAFLNQVAKTPIYRPAEEPRVVYVERDSTPAATQPLASPEQVKEALADLLEPLVRRTNDHAPPRYSTAPAPTNAHSEPATRRREPVGAISGRPEATNDDRDD